MIVGIDIDGTLDAGPAATAFFGFLTGALRAAGHRIVILSCRPFYRELAEGQLAHWGIQYDRLLWADSCGEKAELCRKLGINVLFEDSDECIAGVEEETAVFKVRNAFNFDFQQRKWLGTPEFKDPM